MRDIDNTEFSAIEGGMFDTTIEIRWGGEPRVFPAWMHERVPCLAVLMPEFGVFCVVHVRSGRACGMHVTERAGVAMRTLAQWHAVFTLLGVSLEDVPQPSMFETLGEALEQSVPFGGHTITENNVTRPYTLREWFASEFDSSVRDVAGEFPWEDSPPFDEAVELIARTINPAPAAIADGVET